MELRRETELDAGDPSLFRREVQPALGRWPLARLMEVTGLSEAYCSRIRRGKVVPHTRHWKALSDLAAKEDATWCFLDRDAVWCLEFPAKAGATTPRSGLGGRQTSQLT
jgi:hypothetical protein